MAGTNLLCAEATQLNWDLLPETDCSLLKKTTTLTNVEGGIISPLLETFNASSQCNKQALEHLLKNSYLILLL